MGKAFLVKGGDGGTEIAGTDATFLAQDQLQIGDIVYTINGDIYQNFTPSYPQSYINSIAFSPDGTKLISVGQFKNMACVYKVDGTTLTPIGPVYADNNGSTYGSSIHSVRFSPDGNYFVIGGYFSEKAKLYSVADNTITYVAPFYADTGTTKLGSVVKDIAFSPDMTKIILVGEFAGYAKLYSFDSGTITYLSDIYSTTGTSTPLDNYTNSVKFTPDGTRFIIGGQFTNSVKLYTLSGNTATFAANISQDNVCNTIAMFPSGDKFIIGGFFSNKCKLYTLSGTTATFVTNIYANAGTTIISGMIQTSLLSPDGTKLFIGTNRGEAFVYTISGNIVSYLYNIYDINGAAFPNTIKSFGLSPNGKTLVLAGDIGNMTNTIGGARVYTLSGNTLTYKSDLPLTTEFNQFNSTVGDCVMTPDGKYVIFIGNFEGFAKLFAVYDTYLNYICDVPADNNGTPLKDVVYAIDFAPDGSTFVMGGLFPGKAKIYTLKNGNITFISNIYSDAGTTAFLSTIYTMKFSPDGKNLFIGGEFTGIAKYYSISGTTVTFISNIYADLSNTALSINVTCSTFSPNSENLFIGGAFTSRCKMYRKSGNTMKYVKDLYMDGSGTVFDSPVRSLAITPDGTKLVVGGYFTGKGKIYNITATSATYLSDIKGDIYGTALSGIIYKIYFTPDGGNMYIGGDFDYKAKVYTLYDGVLTFIQNLYENTDNLALNASVNGFAITPDGTRIIMAGGGRSNAKIYRLGKNGVGAGFLSDVPLNVNLVGYAVLTSVITPDNKLLIVGGSFTGKCKVYSLTNGIANYLYDLTMDGANTVFDKEVVTLSVSPDGMKLIVGGAFAGFCKLYSISGSTITFVKNIYMDAAGTVAIDKAVYASAFSPDGNTLVIGGYLAGYAKIYSVSGTAITFVRNMYTDTGTTAFGSSVRNITFSTDGTKLGIVGDFSGNAKVYTVSGTNIVFGSNAPGMNGSITMVFSFSPDGTKVIIGGAFTNKCNFYTLSGTTLTLVGPVYSNNSSTILTNGGSGTSVNTVIWYANGTRFIIGGDFTGFVKLYSLSGTTITYLTDIYSYNKAAYDYACNTMITTSDKTTLFAGGYFNPKANILSISGDNVTWKAAVKADNTITPFNRTTECITFTPDGKYALSTDYYYGYGKVFMVQDGNLTWLSNFYSTASNTTGFGGNYTYRFIFSPDGTKFLMCGTWSGKCKLYEFDNGNVIYKADVKADNANTALNDSVYSAIWNADSTKFIIGGAFTGICKMYSYVNGTIIYLNDIKADNSGTDFNSSVRDLAFTPDYKVLVLGGWFTGKCKLYSFDGTTVTYVKDVKMDNANNAFQGDVYSIALSPDGKYLAVVGSITSYARLYSLSGTTTSLLKIFPSENGTSGNDGPNLNSTAFDVRFSRDGSKVVISGMFTGRCKIYSIRNNVPYFETDIYMDQVNTPIPDATGVYHANFSPNGQLLAIAGSFPNFVKLHRVFDIPKVSAINDAYKWDLHLKLTQIPYYTVKPGYAMEDIAKGSTGTIRILS